MSQLSFDEIYDTYLEKLEPELHKSIKQGKWWSETDSWAVNLAYHLYRENRKFEAGYLIEGVRCGTVKYRTNENSFFSALNRSLAEISSCFREKNSIATLYHRKKRHQKYYLSPRKGRSTSEEGEVQYPHSTYWFQSLSLVYACTLLNVPHQTPSRSEVDPFGTNIFIDNLKWLEKIYWDAKEKSDWINDIHIHPPNWKV